MCGISQDELFKLESINLDEGIKAFNLLKVIATIYQMSKAISEV
jgi:hypothetical protein